MNKQSDELYQLLKRGTKLLQQGKHHQAADVLSKAHKLDSADFDVTLNLSAAYIIGKKFKQAVPLLEQLVEHDPDNSMIWTNLGAAYLGNPVLADEAAQDNAIEAFKRALAINPRAQNVAYNIGLIYKDRKQTANAIEWFEKAFEANPNDADAKSWIEFLTQVEEKQRTE